MTLLTHGVPPEPGAPPDATAAHAWATRCTQWVTAIDPTAEDLVRLREMGFDADALVHALDPHERPRVRTSRDDAQDLFVVLRAPWFAGVHADVPFVTVPIGLVVRSGCGLTICTRDLELVRTLAARIDAGPRRDLRAAVVLHALELVAESFLEHLDRINGTVDLVEDQLQSSLENRQLFELLKYQKSLVYFTSALEAMQHVVERLEHAIAPRLAADDLAELEDIRIELRQALDVSTTSRNVMSEMMDAFASIISNNLNVVMKFLAATTVVLTFPVTVASFYGMNVSIPGAHHPNAFAWSLAVSLVISVAVAAYFRRRGWL
jgi:magnesium transporter